MYSEEKIVSLGKELINRAYAPYSGLKVASIVLTKRGNLYPGVNVENSSYGLTICAERVAVFNAVTSGEPEIETVYIFSETEVPITPCGACRQVIAEFNPNARIVSISLKNGQRKEWSLSQLLPESFTLDKK